MKKNFKPYSWISTPELEFKPWKGIQALEKT
jgi:hypothetical protein